MASEQEWDTLQVDNGWWKWRIKDWRGSLLSRNVYLYERDAKRAARRWLSRYGRGFRAVALKVS